MPCPRLSPAILAKGGFALITADHGNADHMFDVASDGSKHPFTAHTTNRVPFIIVDEKAKLTGIEDRPSFRYRSDHAHHGWY